MQGSLRQLGSLLRSRAVDRCLVVANPGNNKLVDVERSLRAASVKFELFEAAEDASAPLEVVDAAVCSARRSDAQAVVGVGDTMIELSKATAALTLGSGNTSSAREFCTTDAGTSMVGRSNSN